MSLNSVMLPKLRCRFLDRVSGEPVRGVIASLSLRFDPASGMAQLPVGTLCSDGAGYVSYDLKQIRLDHLPIVGLLITAPRFGLLDYDPLVASGAISPPDRKLSTIPRDAPGLTPSASTRARIPFGELPCLVFPIYVDRPVQEQAPDCGASVFPAVQSADVCDYKASPFSFVTPVALRLGNDCCESLTPGSLPVQEYRFNRIVVQQQETAANGYNTMVPGVEEVKITDSVSTLPPVIKFGRVLEYRQNWYSLGHSLGEIKYSLPLAPGESTQLAVIEWSRQDAASRTDNVRATEFLDHDSRRDRAIEDSVDAALREEQGGNSHMGSTSGTATIPMEYFTMTGNHAFGGGISYSYGNRDVEGDSLQTIHDRVRQATASVRSLTSTVIVQASQSEQNNVQTRRVANHNHCHALTIQYYEVLRSYLLQTRFSDAQDAVLIPFSPFIFTPEVAIRFRTLVERSLLDPALASCYDALIRLLPVNAAIYEVPDLPAVVASSGPPQPTMADKQIKVSGTSEKGVESRVTVQKNDKVRVSAQGRVPVSQTSGGYGSAGFGPEGDGPTDNRFNFLAQDLDAYSLVYRIGVTGEWHQGASNFEFVADSDGELIFNINDAIGYFADNRPGFWTVGIHYPSHLEGEKTPVNPEPDSGTGKKATYSKAEDILCSSRLILHLNGNQGYYNGAIWMLLNSVERRLYLEKALQSRPDILDGIDDRPLAVSGNYVAFRYTGGPSVPSGFAPPAVREDVVTLPTRGLFAEAQIGHCNSCEKRDATRMWNWSEMPAEDQLELTGLSPGPKGQAPSLTPSQLPTNVITITQPQAAPDPTGLAEAFGVLKTPGIFRDMAGLQEVSKLLGEMVTAAGDANSKALATQAKSKVDKMQEDGKQTDGNLGSAPKASGISASDSADRMSLLPEIKSFAKDIGLTDEEYKQFALDQVNGTKPTKVSPAPKTAPTAIPQAKPDEVMILVRVRDAWDRPTDADIICTLTDDAIGPQGVLHTGIRSKQTYSSADTIGMLPLIKGLTSGVLDMQVEILSSTYENLSSEVVDLGAGGIPYSFPKGTRNATFYARQAFEDVKVTVDAGNSLGNTVGSALSGKVTASGTIKVVEASLEAEGSHNWSKETNETQAVKKEFTIRIPKSQITVRQETPKLGP